MADDNMSNTGSDNGSGIGSDTGDVDAYDDSNRFGGRFRRYARVNAGVGGFVARAAGSRLFARGGWGCRA